MVWLEEVGSKAMCFISATEDVENIMCIFFVNNITYEAKASECSLCRSVRNKYKVNNFLRKAQG